MQACWIEGRWTTKGGRWKIGQGKQGHSRNRSNDVGIRDWISSRKAVRMEIIRTKGRDEGMGE